MKQLYTKITAIIAFIAALAMPARANDGWPTNYEGVMLQGFYWDSYSDTKWSNLESQADELSKYFKLIWIPNAAKSASSPSMGYDPVYWFTNYTSSFGNETQLRSMIATYKAKGVGFIADVVINHRSGKSNWTDFPAETWNGVTYQLGPEHICCDDEVKDQAGQATPTGDYDSGEGYSAARDLDHKNVTVQENCKAYCRFLLEDMGFVGFRYDMAKGYGGWANKLYNEASKPTYSVGEYFDGSYDLCAAWIEATGKTSAAFDFPFKFAVNDAFNNGDMTKLVWNANGTTPQPAGLIHWWYPQYAVTFLDNHDTYRDSWNSLNQDVIAANAFMLCSPGTPCVFLPHWQNYKDEIKQLIKVRNAVGLNNQSAVTVLKSSTDCYMAEVTGSKGKLVVKVGSSWDSPDGYTSSQIVASGEKYCVWTAVEISSSMPSSFYILGEVNGNKWSPDTGVEMTAVDDENFSVDVSVEGYFSFCKKLASTWSDLNASGNRYGCDSSKEISVGVVTDASTTGDPGAFTVPAGNYTITYNWPNKTVLVSKRSATKDILTDQETDEPEYFTLTGQRVTAPTNGIFIRRTGSRVEKVILH